jgi:hypothetical protein
MIAILGGLLLLQAPAEEEYKTKLSGIAKSAAAKHYGLGGYLSTSQMHLWAREQYYKTIEYDPDHEGARKKLGFKKAEAGGWENDPAARQDFGNKKKGEEADRVRKSFGEKLDAAGKDLGRQWADLALWCKKNMLEKESTDAFRKALEYDPANVTSRKELGYEKTAKGAWISKAERELRRDMKDGIPKASGGQVSQEETDAEKGVGQKHRKRASEHFVVESPHLPDPMVGSLTQHAEHAYAIFHKIMGVEDTFGGRKMHHIILKDKTQHERYVNAFYKGASPAHLKLAMESSGLMGFPRSEHWDTDNSPETNEDMVVHSTIQILMQMIARGEHHWLYEGMAYHFTRLMNDTAACRCVDLAGTSPENKGKNYSDPADWPIVCKVWVRENKDPDINAVLKATNVQELDGAETVKGWSIVEFLIAEHREKFVEFCKALGGGKDAEAALKEVWGWTPGDLDMRWKAYVKMAY